MSIRKLFFSVKQSVRREANALASSLCNAERMSADELCTLNWRRRMELLHSAMKAPLYRDRFQKIGLQPEDVREEKDWNRIPILTRQDIQDHMSEMILDGVSRNELCVASTGGSTGEPLKLYRPKNIPYDAFAARMLDWWGVKMWEDSCYIFRHGYTGWRKAINDTMWWPTRRVFLNAGNLNEEKCAAFHERIKRVKPRLLVGYVGAVAEFADYLVKSGSGPLSDIKAVWTTSAPLPEPLRQSLQNVFNAPVYSQYGCCECGHLAAECSQQDGMHIHSDWRHVEFVDTDGRCVPEGQSGDILITDMYAKKVPLIRYAIGDRGRLMTESCSCGLSLPRMAPVKGRISDAFPMPDGSQLSGDYLTTIFDRFPDSIRGFRVHQNKDFSIRVEYVIRDGGVVKTAIDDARDNLMRISKGQVRVDFVSVDRIPHDRGKTRYVTTDIRSSK